jgi:hypothetical protein
MLDHEIEEMLSDCKEARSARNSPFSPWEKKFIESVDEQYEEKKRLSPKQIETLEEIWEKI